ncbi:hypothetical protein [Desulfitobacterium metallireducens]|uniref:Uncharacterized protein n=1 Tax=Desulfitobacterium metallireducens DSM 15288 TaxID=871968 RepID=W0E8C2_9FIRM|nr:hypothetical protein [Desulfitobacterium metallireducens]AHF07017.1 hypothetical protein DESME_08020 [Desulfitobacterium metallireducens DSM 15288]
MKFKRNGNFKQPISSIVLYTAGTVVALIAIAFLVNNILLFKNVVAQYVDQGYPSSEVLSQLIPNQLLPGVFEPVAVYGGIAFLLIGVGIINRKVSEGLKILTKDETTSLCIDTPEHVEAVEDMSQATTNENEQSPENQI